MPRKRNPYRRELNAWRAMIRRCTEPARKDWRYYGGKGIKVCPEWAASFDSFLLSMGPAPTPLHWLGRLDVSKDYNPDNCVWTTRQPQMNRRAHCRKVMFDGLEMTAATVAKLRGQPSRLTVLRRSANGFPLEIPLAAKLYRQSTWLTHDGESLPLPEWARRRGISIHALRYRISVGMPVSLILTPLSLRRPPVMRWSRPTTCARATTSTCAR